MAANAPTFTSAPATTPATRALLTGGVVAGPLFVIVAFLLALTRDGFDLKRHPFSMLSLGEYGWLQIANFTIAGLLFLLCAVGLSRVLYPGRASTWGPILIGAFGVSHILGGLFRADPGLGFPPGAPEGQPATMSTEGMVHGMSFMLGTTALMLAMLVFARRFAGTKERGWMWYSIASLVLFLGLVELGIFGGDFRAFALSIAVGWGWTSAVIAKLRAPASAG